MDLKRILIKNIRTSKRMKADGATTHRALRGKVCPYFFFLWARKKKGNERSSMAMEIATMNG
jgi:hypothetical protein